MNTNPPNIPEPLTGDEMKLIHIDPIRKTGLVKSDNMKKSLVVKLQDWLIPGVQLMDYVTVEKSKVTGELWVTDYHVNSDFYDDGFVEAIS